MANYLKQRPYDDLSEHRDFGPRFLVGLCAWLVLALGCENANLYPKVTDAATDATSDSRPATADAKDSAASCSPDASGGTKGRAESCVCNNECRSGYCVGGVCCDTACTEGCKACNLPSSLGICSFVPAGVKPSQAGFCAADTPASCMQDGTCDGAGECRKFPEGTLCKGGTCEGDGVVNATACDGKGSCSKTVSTQCAPYTCDPNTKLCTKSCDTNAQCGAGQTCSQSSCGFKRNGSECTAAGECASGNCADGYCCNLACTGACQSCKEPGAVGRCKLLGAGVPDSRCSKKEPSTCDTTGTCDGEGACALYPENTPCGAATCVASSTQNSARVCDGQGTCRDAQEIDCSPYLCAKGACNSSCLSDSDCVAGRQCVASVSNNTTTGRCGKGKPGIACTAASDCESNFCIDGVCCENACEGACRSCSLPGSPGKCTNLPVGAADARHTCKDLGATSCGTNGMCDGSGGCQVYKPGTVCGAETCVGGAHTPAAQCNQSGQCVTPPSLTCNPYVCNGATCFGSCSDDKQCVAGNVCQSGSCGLKADGAECSASKECKSNHCAQGVCCNSDCTAACMACNLTGALGRCSAVADGSPDPQGICKLDATNKCGTTGRCKAGACASVDKGNNCGAASCATATSQKPVSTCDGAGKCITPGNIDCGNYICDANTSSCKNGCTTNNDCRSPNTCSNGSCGLRINGSACTSGGQCLSGFCTEGVCCDSACADASTGGLCKSCRVAGNVGRCSNVPSGQTDPKQRCTASNPDAGDCSNDGTCNGSGACRPWLSTRGCRQASCTGSTLTAAANCDGAGRCPAATTSSCSPFLCSATSPSCRTTCTSNADCVAGETCRVVDNNCGDKLGPGKPCGANADCTSNTCIGPTNGKICCAAGDGCMIDGACYKAGDTKSPTELCAVCDPTKSTTAWSPAASTKVCRAANGLCDVAETCSGTSTSCPANGFAGTSQVCRASAGACDVPESCTGTSASCPADVLRSVGTECRAAGGSCDVAESCTGTTATCPVDGFRAVGTECRAAAGVCDVAETCTGTAAACPTDGFAGATTECRAAAGVCDVAENCTGSSATCPADTRKDAGTQCRAAAGLCDLPATCNGSSAICPDNAFKGAGTQCRAAEDLCDSPATCSGSSATCPANGFKDTGTQCRAAAGLCDLPATCSGSSATCPANAFKDAGTVCRAGVGVCDSAETCSGASANCPANAFAPEGTSCTNDNLTCTSDVCDGSGTCTHSPTSASCLIAGACYGSGDENPQNSCQQCTPSSSQTVWSNKPDTASCNTNACMIGQTCSAGVCGGGTPKDCSDGSLCTTDSCSAGVCINTPTVTCLDPEVCIPATGLCGLPVVSM